MAKKAAKKASSTKGAQKPKVDKLTPGDTVDKGKHPGFKAVSAKIAAKEGLSKKSADAILAASSRGASAKAKKANPRLKRVSKKK